MLLGPTVRGTSSPGVLLSCYTGSTQIGEGTGRGGREGGGGGESMRDLGKKWRHRLGG